MNRRFLLRVWGTAAGVLASSLIGGCGGSGLQTSAPPREVSPASSTVLYSCGGHAAVAPRSLVLACADAGETLGKLRWHGWGGLHPRATGIETVMRCVPTCVAGGFTSHPVAVELGQLQLSGTDATYKTLVMWRTSGAAAGTRSGSGAAARRSGGSARHGVAIYDLTGNGPVVNTVTFPSADAVFRELGPRAFVPGWAQQRGSIHVTVFQSG